MKGKSSGWITLSFLDMSRLSWDQVRRLAEEAMLPTMLRKDSQGICFLGKLKFDDFLHHYLGEDPGEVIYLDEMKVVGKEERRWVVVPLVMW